MLQQAEQGREHSVDTDQQTGSIIGEPSVAGIIRDGDTDELLLILNPSELPDALTIGKCLFVTCRYEDTGC